MRRVALALFGAVLCLLPREFRRRRGGEMLALFDARLGESNAGGVAMRVVRVTGLLLRESLDVAGVALRLRVAAAARRRGTRSDRRNAGFATSLLQDVRHGVVLWLRRPSFTAVAVCTLALGIGVNTAMFSVADAVLLRPLPYAAPDRLVMVWQTIPGLGWRRGPISYPNYVDLREGGRPLFEDMAAYDESPATLSGRGDARQLRGARVTGNLFALLGVRAPEGRVLQPRDDRPAAEPVVVLSHALWRELSAGDSSLLGGTLMLDGVARRVVGVMPSSFGFPSRTEEFWVPLALDAAVADRDLNWLGVIGRLAPGVTLEAARPRLEAVLARLRMAYPGIVHPEGRMFLETRAAFESGSARPVVLVLVGAVALVLLIACANLANLLFIHATSRRRELGVRAALGAGRGRLLRQLLAESALLALAGGALGVAVAVAAVKLVVLFGPDALPHRETIAIDARSLGFTFALACASVLLFGLLPSLRAVGSDPFSSLREVARGTTPGRGRARAQRVLVVVQIALALVLLTGAGLLVHSLLRLTATPPGFDPRSTLAVRVVPSGTAYEDSETGRARVQALFDRLLERIDALPGTAHVGAAWDLPLTGGHASGRITVEGRPAPAGQEPLIGIYPIRGDYFAAMGMTLLRGRAFTSADDADAPPVVIVNETAAARFWPGQDPTGKRFKRGAAEEDVPWITVVGVARDVKRAGLDQAVMPEAYWPHPQADWAMSMYVVVRAAGDPLRRVVPIRAALRAIDPGTPISQVTTLDALLRDSIAEPRFRTLLIGAFAALAALLALLGIYGVVSFAVAQRRQEIGVRMALGAGRASVLRDVLGQGMRLALAGIALGLAGAAAASRLIESLLFDVRPLDARTYAGVTLLVAAGALLACWLPARRAARVDPAITLREE